MEGRLNQGEWEDVRLYCCERPLERPKTNLKTAAFATLLFLAVAVLLSLAMIQLLSWLSTLFQLHWIAAHPVATNVLACMVCCLLCFLFSLKRMVIGLVRLYQHYAPEDLRRKCILKPTCSEYMILAVEKYGVFRGVKKGVYRLFFTCRGWDYRVDEP